MRLLHISDWHIGLTTGPHSRHADHERVFGEIVAIVRDRKPDLILHTGDVFHVGYPAVDDMRFGIEALQELAAFAQVVVLRGNHDSDRLFRVFATLLGPASRLTFIDLPPRLDGDPVLRFRGNSDDTIALLPLPFVHANRFITHFDEAATQSVTFADKIGRYERLMGEKLRVSLDPKREVAIFAAHQYVQGASKSGSERALHVGDEYATRSGDLPSVSYAAFGHIHKPQLIPSAVAARYAGSPIQIDFGEENEAKSVVFIDASPQKAPLVETLSLSGGRPLRTVGTTLAELPMHAEHYAGALVRITVRTDTPVTNLAQRVAEGLPDTDIVEVIEDCVSTRLRNIEEYDGVHEAEPSLPALFAEFLGGRPVRNADAERVRAAFELVLAAVEAHETPSFLELPVEVNS
jgi:exonuclease SbcD